MNWQEWVVGLLIVLCVARILYGIYLFFRRVKESDNPCASCASGCELKDMMEKKQKECSSKKNETGKEAAAWKKYRYISLRDLWTAVRHH